MFLTDMDRPGIALERNMDAHGPLLHRRPRRGALREPARAGQRRAGRAGQGLSLRAGAAGAGAPDPLHALAGSGAPRARRRRRLRRAGARPSASRWPSTRASASCWPTTTWTCTPRACTSGTPPGCWTRAQQVQLRVEPRQGGRAPRPQWRVVDRCVQILGGQGVTGETAGDAHLHRHARLPHLRRPQRSAPLEHGAQDRARGRGGRWQA